MAIRDVEAQNRSLINDYLPSSASYPDYWEVALYAGDPFVTDDDDPLAVPGVEVTGPGYAPAQIVEADWDVPTAGTLMARATFPAPTGPWTPMPDHWATRDPRDGTVWDAAPLQRPVAVTAASPLQPVIDIAIYASDTRTDDL